MDAERFVRKRFLRIALALMLIAVATWTFMPYVTHRVAASAFVNSELIRVTAPFAGRLAQTLPRQGLLFEKTTQMTLVEALSPDRRHFLDLDRQYALAKESSELARQQLQEVAALDEELGKRAEAFRLNTIDRIVHEASEAEAERAGCLAEVRQRREVASRMLTLARSGFASEIRSAEVLATQEAAATRCEVASARIARIQVELNAALNGVFLRDGSNDVPYSQQQRDRLLLRRQELQTLALQESARAARLAAEIEAERDRMARLDNYKVDLPAAHLVWSTAASPGSAVTEGQILLDLADCEHRFVAVELPERDFEQIKLGDIAAVRLVGSDEWRQGLVRQVRGSAARSDDRLFAAQIPSGATPGTITVEVSLPPDVMEADESSFCGIGRLAEVRFRRPLLDVANLVMEGWRRLMRSSGLQTASNVHPGG